jgi:hypothetical protein
MGLPEGWEWGHSIPSEAWAAHHPQQHQFCCCFFVLRQGSIAQADLELTGSNKSSSFSQVAETAGVPSSNTTFLNVDTKPRGRFVSLSHNITGNIFGSHKQPHCLSQPT